MMSLTSRSYLAQKPSELRKQVESDLYPLSGTGINASYNFQPSGQQLTADDLTSAFTRAINAATPSQTVINIDGKKVASSIAAPMDSALATRQSRLARY